MIYEEFAPSGAIRPFVDRLWVLEADAGVSSLEPVLPDGYLEIIVHAGDPFFEVTSAGDLRRQAPALLAGQLTRATHLKPGGATRVAGARLRANGAWLLLGVPQWELTDRVVDLSAVHRQLARALVDDVSGRTSRRDLAAALDRALARIRPAHDTPNGIGRALDVAAMRRGLVGVDALARAAGTGVRQLQRSFRDEVGIAPKRLLRVWRFQEVLRHVRGEADRCRWADLAAACGFYDQAHFVHDFRSFTGQPPSAWNVTAESLTVIFSALRRDSPPD